MESIGLFEDADSGCGVSWICTSAEVASTTDRSWGEPSGAEGNHFLVLRGPSASAVRSVRFQRKGKLYRLGYSAALYEGSDESPRLQVKIAGTVVQEFHVVEEAFTTQEVVYRAFTTRNVIEFITVQRCRSCSAFIDNVTVTEVLATRLANRGFEQGLPTPLSHFACPPQWTCEGHTAVVESGDPIWGSTSAAAGHHFLAMEGSATGEQKTSVRQIVLHHIPGANYMLEFAYAKQAKEVAGTPELVVRVGDISKTVKPTLSTFTPDNISYVATAESMLYEFENSGDDCKGCTIFIDALSISEAPCEVAGGGAVPAPPPAPAPTPRQQAAAAAAAALAVAGGPADSPRPGGPAAKAAARGKAETRSYLAGCSILLALLVIVSSPPSFTA